MSDGVPQSLDQVHSLALRALTAQGFSHDQASAIATTITAAERDRCESHGLFRIPFYIKASTNPNANKTAVPILKITDSSIVRVDGAKGFCPLALSIGLDPLADKARERGIAALAINNTYNIAALWPEVEALAERGLVAFAFTAANAFVAPAGGTKPLYGTNPMAFAWPRTGQPPMVFDQASSASARGEIQLHLRDGKPLPPGWAIDVKGQPTTDPAEALAGAQLTFGGYKGAALALMIELLAGALIGDLFSFESTERDTHGTGAPFGGEFIIAISPDHFHAGGDAPHAFDRAELLFEKILAQDGTRLPSSRRFAARAATAREGVSVNETLFNTIKGYIG